MKCYSTSFLNITDKNDILYILRGEKPLKKHESDFFLLVINLL